MQLLCTCNTGTSGVCTAVHLESSDVYIGDVKNGSGICNLLISGELTLIAFKFY